MSNSNKIQQAFLGVAILASISSVVHETKLNKALALTAPLTNLSVNLPAHLEGLHEVSSAHTHVEKVSVSQQFATGTPKMQARDDHRRYNLPKSTSRGDTYFGGSTVLWPSI